MRRLTLTIATLATLACAATAAQANSYYGPRQVGNMCWKHQLGNSLGYWTECKPATTAQARVARPHR